MSDERFARQYRYKPPPEFPLASPSTRIDHHLSGPIMSAPTRIRPEKDRSVVRPRVPTSRFRFAPGFIARALARMVDSLVRVSRRVDRNHFVNVERHRKDPPGRRNLEPRAAADARDRTSRRKVFAPPNEACLFYLGPIVRVRDESQTEGPQRNPTHRLPNLFRTTRPTLTGEYAKCTRGRLADARTESLRLPDTMSLAVDSLNDEPARTGCARFPFNNFKRF